MRGRNHLVVGDGYADDMSKQIAVKLPERLLQHVDRKIVDGALASRADAVRRGLGLLLRELERERVAQAYRDGYARTPETAQELDEARRLGIASIEEEPWERWW